MQRWSVPTSGFIHGTAEQPTSSRTVGTNISEKVRRMLEGSECTLGRGFFVSRFATLTATVDLMVTFTTTHQQWQWLGGWERGHTRGSGELPGYSRSSSPSDSVSFPSSRYSKSSMTEVTVGEWDRASARPCDFLLAIPLVPKGDQFPENKEARHGILSYFCRSGLLDVVRRP